MTLVQGKNAFLQVKVGDNYKYAGCMQTISIRQNVEDIETTTVDSITDREYEAGFNTSEGTFGGVTSINSFTNYQYQDFVDNKRGVQDFRVTLTDDDGNTLQYDFKAKTQSIELNNQAGQLSKYTVNFLVSGAISTTKDYNTFSIIQAIAIGTNTVRVIFNKTAIPTTVGWSVFIQDTLTTTSLTAVTGSGSIWDFTTFDAMSAGQTLFISYNAVTGTTTDDSLTELPTTSLFPVLNSTLGEPIYSDTWETVAGQDYIEGLSTGWRAGTQYSLVGKEIIAVYREGHQYDLVANDSVPGNRQSSWQTTTDRLLFANNFNPGETVFVIFK